MNPSNFTIFAATTQIRQQLGKDDWCISVFKDNAGVVTFDDQYHVCFKVETHNHPSALEPYGGANTGIGGVIRDTIGTGLGAKPICNTDVFCFAPPDTPYDALPAGVLHPKTVAQGVISGVRDYGNRMGIPTSNGAVLFNKGYIANPLVFCGTVGMIPVDKKQAGRELAIASANSGGAQDGDLISVELIRSRGYGLPSGKVRERLGSLKTEKAVSLIAIHAHEIPQEFQSTPRSDSGAYTEVTRYKTVALLDNVANPCAKPSPMITDFLFPAESSVAKCSP